MSKLLTNNRRDFIKLASGAVAAPFLALPSRKVFGQSKPPLRFLTLVDTYGVPTANRNDSWIRSSSGDYALQANDLGTILQPLAAYRDNMLVVSNISLSSREQSSDARTHHFLTTHALTGSAALNSSRGAEASQAIKHASIDIHIGDYLHNQYGLSSPRIFDHLFFTDYGQANAATFCYTKGGVQKRSIRGALNARNALFSDIDTSNLAPTQIANTARLDAITLVRERLDALAGSLVNANRDEVIEAYQESVDSVSRELELKNQNVITMPAELASGLTNASSGTNDPNTLPNMFKNIYHAFAFDMASSITYAFGGEKINQLKHTHLYNASEHNDTDLRSLLAKNFHSPSHRTDAVANKTHELVRTYQSQELATLLDRLSATPDSDGSTLLDNTVVFFTSQMSNNTHKTDDYALFVIAGKNTNLQGGFHYDCGNSTNNDLLTTIAQGLTLPDESFGGHNKAGNYLNALNNGPISKMLKG